MAQTRVIAKEAFVSGGSTNVPLISTGGITKIIVSNVKTPVGPIKVSVSVFDAGVQAYIVKNADVPVGTSIVILEDSLIQITDFRTSDAEGKASSGVFVKSDTTEGCSVVYTTR